jgi:hypothetical protein
LIFGRDKLSLFWLYRNFELDVVLSSKSKQIRLPVGAVNFHDETQTVSFEVGVKLPIEEVILESKEIYVLGATRIFVRDCICKSPKAIYRVCCCY